jgi:hypothetical protein
MSELPWVYQQQQAALWAQRLARTTPLGAQARAEGWEPQLIEHAACCGRQMLNMGRRMMPVDKYRPSAEALASFRKK